MADLNRRQMLSVLGAAPAAVAFTWTPAEAREASAAIQNAAQAGQPYVPRFFTAAEFALVIALVDIIIPRDGRSGSASEAGAPAFIDYIVAEQPNRQMPMRGGLAWLNAECQQRFEKPFLTCSDTERRLVLDDIAWPAKAKPEFSHGVAFFTTMRDLTAAGFFSSKIGMADVGYMGNGVSAWDGAPAAVLQKLGVSYQE
jgi:gluconate 2-dehydrogenase gamma chain